MKSKHKKLQCDVNVKKTLYAFIKANTCMDVMFKTKVMLF